MNWRNWIVGIAAVGVIVAVICTRLGSVTSDNDKSTLNTARHAEMPHLPAIHVATAAQPEELSGSNFIARLANGDAPKLTPEQIEAYLTANHRNAQSLIAAFRASGDKAYLREAEKQFPDDPRVNFTAAYNSDSPAERQQWLEHFKLTAPDNSLANYLLAREYLKTGQTDQAMRELAAAGGKADFQEYSTDFVRGAAEAYLSAGFPSGAAKMIANSQLQVPYLGDLKQLGLGLGGQIKAYQQAGDSDSANALLQMAMNLGRRLDQPTEISLIQNLVGIAVQRIALNEMNPSAPYGNNGQTVQDQLDRLNRERAAINAVGQYYPGVEEKMSDQDMAAFSDRRNQFGESAALQWAAEKFGGR